MGVEKQNHGCKGEKKANIYIKQNCVNLSGGVNTGQNDIKKYETKTM